MLGSSLSLPLMRPKLPCASWWKNLDTVARLPFPSLKKSSLLSPNGKCNDFCRRKVAGGMPHGKTQKGTKTDCGPMRNGKRQWNAPSPSSRKRRRKPKR